jgi:two-component system, NarL family, nitrate/nitrite response regulator NarL
MQTGDPVDIYIIDKCAIFREGVKKVLRPNGFSVCGEAACIGEAIARFVSCGPALLLTEYPGDESSRKADLQALDAALPDARIVVLAPRMNLAWLRHSLSAGADAFLMRNVSCDGLLHSLRLVLEGQKVMPSDLGPLLMNNAAPDYDAGSLTRNFAFLTQRERSVLQGLILGQSNKDIARSLGIAEPTVKVHVKGVLKKLNLHNRMQAAIWAVNSGLGGWKRQPRNSRDRDRRAATALPEISLPLVNSVAVLEHNRPGTLTTPSPGTSAG